MVTALYHSVAGKATLHKHYNDLASQSIGPLDTLAAKSPNLAKWRSVAMDGQIVPSYVLIGPRIGRVPIRLGLFGGVRALDFLSTISNCKAPRGAGFGCSYCPGFCALRLSARESNASFWGRTGLLHKFLEGFVRSRDSFF